MFTHISLPPSSVPSVVTPELYNEAKFKVIASFTFLLRILLTFTCFHLPCRLSTSNGKIWYLKWHKICRCLSTNKMPQMGNYTWPQVTGGSQNVGTTRCRQLRPEITFRHVSEGYMKKWIPCFDLGLIPKESHYIDKVPNLGEGELSQNNSSNSETLLVSSMSDKGHSTCYDQELEGGILVGLLKCGIMLFIFAAQWHRVWALGMFTKWQTRWNRSLNVPKYRYHWDHFLFSMLQVL